MVVLDTSALISYLARFPPIDALNERLDDAVVFHAPHLIEIEFLHVLRRFARQKMISGDRGVDLLTDLARLRLYRHGQTHLLPRVWELRDNKTAYDAIYIALAERLQLPLVTTDARLAEGAPAGLQIEVYAA